MDTEQSQSSPKATVNLFSGTKNSFNSRFPYIRQALADLPPQTVVDGEVVAIDENGRPKTSISSRAFDKRKPDSILCV